MRIEYCNTLVVGAGAAGLNAADELAGRGVDVLLAADSLSGGTSRNAGSDKQTYYKLSLAGDVPDSVSALARDFFAGGGMHGDHARALAARSAAGFLKLAQLGVPFPHNRFGEYVGYQTDHDRSLRATSAGPLTSRFMAEALERSARARGARFADGMRLLSLLTDGEGRLHGALFLRHGDFCAVSARHVVLCTGGAASIFRDTVYPAAQRGALGLALRAGAAGNNLCYWQYGLASLAPRWNVSGSYQQALPAYTDGREEVLSAFLPEEGERLDMVFLKGYQWPFDSRKAGASGRVDLAVAACQAEGKHVYLDFTREGGNPDRLGREGREYLARSGALAGKTPYERLQAMNPEAAAFYRDRGVDLSKEPLEIGLCAQHMNGGLRVDEWWRTTVPGLYAAGETAGVFGPYRPGGSALNETQCGSWRAAVHIASHGGGEAPEGEELFLGAVRQQLEREVRLFSLRGEDRAPLMERLRAGMSACAGILRSKSGMRGHLREVEALLGQGGEALAGTDPEQTADLIDLLHAQRAALSAMLCQADYAGGAGHLTDSQPPEGAAPCADFAFETEGARTCAVPLRPLPEGGGWFERVWKDYREGKVFE